MLTEYGVIVPLNNHGRVSQESQALASCWWDFKTAEVWWCPRMLFNMTSSGTRWQFNTLRPKQNGRHFSDDIFKWIFLNENVWISINISLKFVPRRPINNIPTLVQVMAWRRPGDKPLPEPMMVRLPTQICVNRLNELSSYACAECQSCQMYKVFFVADNVVTEISKRHILINNLVYLGLSICRIPPPPPPPE